MDPANAAKFMPSLNGPMTPSMKAAIDFASNASITGVSPAHRRILDMCPTDPNLAGSSVPSLTRAVNRYTEHSDIASIGKELARHPTVATLAAGQTFSGSGLTAHKALQEVVSSSAMAGSLPAAHQWMESTLAKEGLGSKLAGVTRIASRHQSKGGRGAIPDFVRLAFGEPSASQTFLNSEIYRLAAQALPRDHFSFIRDHRDLAKIQQILPRVPFPGLSAAMMPTIGAGALETALLAGSLKHHDADYRRWRGGGAASVFDALGLSSKFIDTLGMKTEVPSSVLELTAAGFLPGEKERGALPQGLIEPVLPAPRPVSEAQPAPARQLPTRRDHEVAPVAASFFAGEDRQMVIALLDAADLDAEHEHLEALEERLRTGHAPARNHAAVSARQLLLGVANHVFPARSESRRCRFGCPRCPHELGSTNVNNRIVAFVDKELVGKLDSQEFRIFVAHADYVYRWGARGTHQNLNSTDAVRAFVRLLEVLAMVARAYGIRSPSQPC